MKSVWTRAARASAVVGAGLVGAAALAFAAGARINTTKSIAIGLYWTVSGPVRKGNYVMFCPPATPVFDMARRRGYIDSGRCSGGYGYMMKRVLAAKGDQVEIDRAGVFVNGVRLPYSVPHTADRLGQPLPSLNTGAINLGPDDVLLMTDVSSTSFDARYFGPTKLGQIKWVIRPIFTW